MHSGAFGHLPLEGEVVQIFQRLGDFGLAQTAEILVSELVAAIAAIECGIETNLQSNEVVRYTSEEFCRRMRAELMTINADPDGSVVSEMIREVKRRGA